MHRVAIAVLALLTLRAADAHAEPLSCTFWLDPIHLDLTDQKNLSPLLACPKPRLIVPVFTGGHTLFPTQSKVFKIHPQYDQRYDVVADLIGQVKARGGEIYLGVECYRWHRRDASHLPDVLANRLDWAEIDASGKADAPEGRFACPFHPEVQTTLKDLIREITERYPKADGIFLDVRMSRSKALTFAPASLEQYRKQRKAEPPKSLDYGDDLKAKNAVHAWAADRCWGIRDFFFNQVILELRKNPALPTRVNKFKEKETVLPRFIMHFQANWRGLKPERMFAVPVDWIQFRAYHFVDEAILEHDWAPEADRNDVAFYGERSFLTKNTTVDLNALLPPPSDPSFQAAFGNLYGQFVDRFTVRVETPADVAKAARFARVTLKEAPNKPMRCTWLQLRFDPRLTREECKFREEWSQATYAEAMQQLSAKTGVPYAMHPDIEPEVIFWKNKQFGGGAVPPWFVMECAVLPYEDVKARDGYWGRFGDGYMLVPAKPIKAEPVVAAGPGSAPPPVGSPDRSRW